MGVRVRKGSRVWDMRKRSRQATKAQVRQGGEKKQANHTHTAGQDARLLLPLLCAVVMVHRLRESVCGGWLAKGRPEEGHHHLVMIDEARSLHRSVFKLSAVCLFRRPCF